MTINRDQAIEEAKNLGIVHPKTARTSTIIKMINDLTGKDYTEEKKEAVVSDNKFIKCIVHSFDRNNEEIALEGSINGEYFQIPLGIEVQLPTKYKTVVNDARIVRHKSVLNAKGEPTGEIKTFQEPRYIIEAI